MLTSLKQFFVRVIHEQISKIADSKSYDIKYALQLRALYESVDWIIEQGIPLELAYTDRYELLKISISRVSVQGLFLEFGVYKGDTIRFIANQVKKNQVYGFDSFEGLKEPWIYREKGAFSDVKGEFPEVPDNVQLIKGFFQDTLEKFKEDNNLPIAFLHIDSDLYSSASYILNILSSNIISGTVIVFDEFFNYPNWKKGEYKAWNEFVKSNGVRYEVIGFTHQRTARHKSGNQVAFRIL